jgi:hypothetical protein
MANSPEKKKAIYWQYVPAGRSFFGCPKIEMRPFSSSLSAMA